MAFVKAIVTAYLRQGKDPAQALGEAQIAPEQVNNADARITAWQMETLSGTAMQELDDEALGWFSRRLPWGSYGMLARASISAPTLHLALTRWCRHHGLIAPDIALELSVAGNVATIAIKEHSDRPAPNAKPTQLPASQYARVLPSLRPAQHPRPGLLVSRLTYCAFSGAVSL